MTSQYAGAASPTPMNQENGAPGASGGHSATTAATYRDGHEDP
jgi:hypothetical protein